MEANDMPLERDPSDPQNSQNLAVIITELNSKIEILNKVKIYAHDNSYSKGKGNISC